MISLVYIDWLTVGLRLEGGGGAHDYNRRRREGLLQQEIINQRQSDQLGIDPIYCDCFDKRSNVEILFSSKTDESYAHQFDDASFGVLLLSSHNYKTRIV